MELLKAIRKNSDSEVKLILKSGFNPNTLVQEYDNKMHIYYNTIPLCVAAANGYVQIARSLIKHGADINANNNAWSSPLHLATYCGHESMIKMLIMKNANINLRDSRGNTALHEACRLSRVGCVDLFLKYNVDLTIRNNDFKTAFDLAEEKKSKTIINLLKTRLNDKNNAYMSIYKTDKIDVKNVSKKNVRFHEEVTLIIDECGLAKKGGYS
ncbi:GA-binding protein subunit beta-2 [Hydra vulgaris]|uniref:GA-binding protein subunit beta-2 n=1 Tax=Hydra vulgaris TaxID=6087 RepID=UPI001F5EAB92|nr:GA-binding protein subunit beta-2 [Hydra vulgaris]